MKVTYIHHSGFLVESDRCYYLFDYETGTLPPLDTEKPILVLSSHGHEDHYNEEIFIQLAAAGMHDVRAILSDDITPPEGANVLRVSPGMTYDLGPRQTLTTLRSTDLGVAFLIRDGEAYIYHAGDLNDWVWEEESDSYNREMTENYRAQMNLLAQMLNGQVVDTAFVVLDPRQEADYDRGLCYFLENIPVKRVYPMHYWGTPAIIKQFLKDHPKYQSIIQLTEE